ncbi:YfmQ family protein [Niallia nealsonii]|uniref:YfmQ n=1 Tax=Niallia nealsonii TaxID=115979 RepID=A0A2N0Z0D7_9BACI|nr:YfmQ family protein [Niallia nealsonii]PKG22973.1 hypothetical protein CWS01_14975 [Niallia nealsonii]
MTWAVIITTLVVCMIKVLMTCLPTGVVNWLIRKYEMHSKLNDENATITVNGKNMKGEEKIQFIHYFNEATVLEKYQIFSGYNEHLYLHPENGGTPIVINAKQGRKNIKISVYSYDDHVDVVKQYKKKIVAYSLRSDNLQNVLC